MWFVVNGGGSKASEPLATGQEAAELAEHWNNFWGTTDYRPREIHE